MEPALVRSLRFVRRSPFKFIRPQRLNTSSRLFTGTSNRLAPLRTLHRLNFTSSSPPTSATPLENLNEYNAITDDTLHHLVDKFEDIVEADASRIGTEADVSYSDGVLTVNLGSAGIYVINKQTPNRQIWLSSPISGPKRYDYINGDWVYSHDGVRLLDLLDSEISSVLGRPANLA